MALIGYKGLPSLYNVSDATKQRFLASTDGYLGQFRRNPIMYDRMANQLYQDISFIHKFGRDSFRRLPDHNTRMEFYEHSLINEDFYKKFQDDESFLSMLPQLDDRGMIDLMNNNDFLGSKKRKELFERNQAAAQSVASTYEAADSPYTDAAFEGFNFMSKSRQLASPYEKDEENQKADQEILDKLYAETQERRESESSADVDNIFRAIQEDDRRGIKSYAEYLDDFESLADKVSPYYQAFKDSRSLEDYSNIDKLQDLAKFEVLRAKYGEGVAKAYLDRTIQNRIAEDQDGRPTWNTLTSIFTTALADMGSNIAYFAHLATPQERMAIYHQGKNPDAPIYNDKGEIIDYEWNDDIWTNPAYWNNVSKFNELNPTEIKAIVERGGISDSVNVREFGHTPTFWSWETLQEGFKQGGHVLAFIADTYLTGKVGGLVGKAARTGLRAAGTSEKALATMGKVGTVAKDVTVPVVGSLSGGMMEASGTFEEVMQNGRERIQTEVNRALSEYYNSLDLSDPEAQQGIRQIYSELKQEDLNRVREEIKRGNAAATPMNDNELMDYAKERYVQTVISAEEKRLQALHDKDMLEVAKDAQKAYTANLIMNVVKEAPLATFVQKFKIAKGVRPTTFDNTISKSIMEDLSTGGVKRALNKAGKEIRRTSAKNIAKETVKQFGAGFADEYIDGLNSSFAEGLGDHMFNNYINKTYNPEAYYAATDTMLGSLMAGMDGAIEGLTDRGNIYEGLIGMISPIATTMPNVNALFSPKDTWQAIRYGVNDKGEKINFWERVSSVVTNPLINTYSELREQDRRIDNTIKLINSIVESKKENLEDASKIISALRDNSYTPLGEFVFGTSENGMVAPSFIDTRDSKLYNAYTLAEVLSTLENVEGGTTSALYKKTMETMKGLAEGKLSDEAMKEEVDKFLADPSNKSIVDMKPERARQVAAERLQDNAQYFMKVKEKIEDIKTSLSSNPVYKNMDSRVQNSIVYSLTARDDYKERLENLETELGVGNTDTDSLYTPDFAIRYGTQKARARAVEARNRTIKDLNKDKEKLNKKKEEAQKKIEELKYKLDRTTGEKRKEITDEIKKQETLIKSYDFQEKNINEKIDVTNIEKEAISKLIGEGIEDTAFNEFSIMTMDARDRAALFDPDNKNNYSKSQRQVIDNLRSKFLMQDSSSMDKIRDAGILAQRIQDVDTLYARLMDNQELASSYFDTVVALRNQNAFSEALQQEIEKHYSKIEQAYDNEQKEKLRKEQEEKEKKLDYLNNKKGKGKNRSRYNRAKQRGRKFNSKGKGKTLADVRRENKEKNPEPIPSLREAALATTSKVLEAYMEDHPDQESAIRPYYELARAGEDAAYQVNKTSIPEPMKATFRTLISDFQRNSANVEEFMDALEDMVDDDMLDGSIRSFFDSMLREMEKLNHQRNATKVEKRKAKQAEEERLRKEAEQAAQATGNSTTTPPPPPGTTSPPPSGTTGGTPAAGANKPGTAVTPDGTTVTVESSSEEEEDIFDTPSEGAAKASESPSAKDTGTKPAETKPAEKRKTVTVANIMDDDIEEASVSYGEMWDTLSPPEKDELTIDKTVEDGIDGAYPTITCNIGGTITTLTITPQEWEFSEKGFKKEDKEKYNIADDAPFNAYRLVQKDSGWYLHGSFEGQRKRVYVKVSPKFDLQKAIDREKAAREVANASNIPTPSTAEDVNVITVDDDTVTVETPDLRSQVNDVKRESGSQNMGIVGEDSDAVSDTIEESMSERTVTLTGNGMGLYEIDPLKNLGKLVVQRGKKKSKLNPFQKKDPRERFLEWIQDRKDHLQDIIDDELPLLVQNNPDIQVKFMCTTTEENATGDNRVDTRLFLVVDYDENINKGITRIHKEKNGGVITSKGKDYLIIGTVGYPTVKKDGSEKDKINQAKEKLYYNLFNTYVSRPLGLVVKDRDRFFAENKGERFYVPENLSTKIVPFSMIPGNIANQNIDEEAHTSRDILDLLNDRENSNPHNYSLRTLNWGIQKGTEFWSTASLSEVMVPVLKEENMGHVFALATAANGKYVPIYINPLKYHDMRDGALKNEIIQLFRQLTLPGVENYNKRLQACVILNRKFNLGPKTHRILLRKSSSVIGLQKKGDDKPFAEFNLDRTDFDFAEFLKKFDEMNPIVNITPEVLLSEKELLKYNEAGALQTDAIKLGTYGVSYSIYGLSSTGKILEDPEAASFNPGKPREHRRENRAYVPMGKDIFEYNRETEIYVSRDTGKKVTKNDAYEYNQLEWNRYIHESGLEAVKNQGEWKIYVINAGDNIQVIRKNVKTHKIESLSEDAAKAIIDEIRESKEAAQREKAAQEKLKEIISSEETEEDIIDETTSEEEVKEDIEEPETKAPETSLVTEGTSEPKEEKPAEVVSITGKKEELSIAALAVGGESGTQDFISLYNNNFEEVDAVVYDKWPDAPTDEDKLKEFLKNKGVPVEGIGTTKEDLDAWIHTVKCRQNERED